MAGTSETANIAAHEAVEVAVIAAADEGSRIEAEITEARIENAVERAEQAEAAGQAVFDAALFTTLGQRVDALQTRIEACERQDELSRDEGNSLRAQMAELSEKITAMASLITGMNMSPNSSEKPLLTREASAEPITEALETTLPAELKENVVAESQEAPARRRARLFR